MILIAFRYNDPRYFSRLVTIVRGGDSAHVEAATPIAGSHLSLCVSASFLDGGVRGKVIDITNPHKWRVYRWDGQHADLIEWLKPRVHMGYDLRGLFGILSKDIGHSKTKMFCSEAVAHMLGNEEPHRQDLNSLEAIVKRTSAVVVWSGLAWVDAHKPINPHGLAPAL